LRAISEIVHNIDLKDCKFGRVETSGIAHLIAGLTLANKSDEQRVSRGAAGSAQRRYEVRQVDSSGTS
jgi:hypothetical protein